MQSTRLLPVLPPTGRRLKVLFDTDFATEIDDLYAIALALCSGDRFDIVGFNAAHFAQKAGRESIEQSYNFLLEVLAKTPWKNRVPIARGSDPLRYVNDPVPSEGVDQIVALARAASPEDPLWVVALGASSTPASAILLAPDIAPNVRYVLHVRSEQSWPTHNEQYNVWGDIHAARSILASAVPLVWFDTGEQLTCSMETTAARLAPCGEFGAYLHAFRDRKPYYQNVNKGFFDVADVAWMLDPTLCTTEVVGAPSMGYNMRFDHRTPNGEMLHVTKIRPEPTWDLFFDRLRRGPHPA
jgi:inosine-uridine nucleoside N-ribohydrolase